MKIIIFSDSHRSFNPMMNAIEREAPVDMIIHAGDVIADVEDLQIMYPRHSIAYVKGNNDFWDRSAPEDRIFEVDGVKIFLTHGHNYGVKYSYDKLIKTGFEKNVDICIFGHTHKTCNQISGGLTIFNPGSASRHYGILEINHGNFSLEIRNI